MSKGRNGIGAPAVVFTAIGLIGLVIGIFAMTPYNEPGSYHHIIGGGLQMALLICGLGISFTLLGLWRAWRSR